MAESKKYYWLKLKRDFFKRHDIRIVEAMPNGKDYILFYLKLMLESIDHEGELRFSDTIPYSEQMLSVVTDTNIDIVRSALKIFTELKMMEVLEDETIYMTEVEKLVGSETEWAGKKREQRLKKDNVLALSLNCPTEKELYKELNKENRVKGDICASPRRFTKPSLEEVSAYCAERGNNVDAEKWYDYYESNGWRVGKNAMKDWKAAVRTWEKREEPKSTKGAPTDTPKYGNFDINEAFAAALERSYEDG